MWPAAPRWGNATACGHPVGHPVATRQCAQVPCPMSGSPPSRPTRIIPVDINDLKLEVSVACRL